MATGSADRAFRALRRRMANGPLGPNGKVNESALARDIGVSRTPLREALNRLVGAGLLRARHGDGFQDSPNESRYLMACANLRRDLLWMALEPTLAQPRDLARLIARMKAGLPNTDGLRDAQGFVLRLAAQSGNGALVRQLDGLNATLAASDRTSGFVCAHTQRDRLVLALALGRRTAAWSALSRLLDLPEQALPAPSKMP